MGNVVWRTTSAVHPHVLQRVGRLLPKHGFFTQPRVDAINGLTASQLEDAGVTLVDVAAMTRLRPDLLEPGDMRHYGDHMHAEMANHLAAVICPRGPASEPSTVNHPACTSRALLGGRVAVP